MFRIFSSRRSGQTPPGWDEPGGDSGPSRRGFWWWGAAAFAGGVVIALVAVLLFGSSGGDGGHERSQAGGKPGGSQPTGGSGQPPQHRPAGCRTSDTDQTVPQQAPKGIKWKMRNGTALPTSKAAGPKLRDGAATYCYGHTPVGALLAGWDIAQGLHGAGGQQVQQFDQLKQHSLVDNDYARQLRRIAAESDKGGDTEAGGGGDANAGQLAGFKFVSYSRQVATITLVAQFAGHEGAYQAQTITLRWQHGDWRYQIQPGPRLAATVNEVADLSDYIPFSGVN